MCIFYICILYATPTGSYDQLSLIGPESGDGARPSHQRAHRQLLRPVDPPQHAAEPGRAGPRVRTS